MATLRYILSSKGERPDIIARLRINDQKKIQVKIPGLLGFRGFWSDAKQTHTTKFVNPELLEEVNNINKSLAELSAYVLALLATMPDSDVDKSWLKDAIDEFLHPKRKARPHTLLALIDEFMATSQVRMQAKGRTISARTLEQYKVTKMWVASFLDARHMNDLAIERLDEAFYADFVTFLYRNNQRPNTVGKHIKNIKAVINSLPSNERMAIEFVEKGKCRIIREDVDNVYLNEDELGILNEHIYTDKRLSFVRDQFLMMAWTGCRYSDLGKLTKDNIITLDGGLEYYRIVQRKTGAKVTIPILPPARAILERYGYVLPAPSTNQYFNRMVRLACREAGITGQVVITRQVAAKSKFGAVTLQDVAERKEKCDCVTAHTARRSFATNMYKRGMPSLMIMAITGHKTEKAFLTYIKVSADENAKMMMERFLQAEKFP